MERIYEHFIQTSFAYSIFSTRIDNDVCVWTTIMFYRCWTYWTFGSPAFVTAFIRLGTQSGDDIWFHKVWLVRGQIFVSLKVPSPTQHLLRCWFGPNTFISIGFQLISMLVICRHFVQCLAKEDISLMEKILQTLETLGVWMSSNRHLLNFFRSQFVWLGVAVDRFPNLICISAASLFWYFSPRKLLCAIWGLPWTGDCAVCTLNVLLSDASDSHYTHFAYSSSTTTLVHAFICSRVGYGNAIYAHLIHSCIIYISASISFE